MSNLSDFIAGQSAADILSKIKTVDGAASGLDADLLDGQQASAFSQPGHTHLIGDLPTEVLTETEANGLYATQSTAVAMAIVFGG